MDEIPEPPVYVTPRWRLVVWWCVVALVLGPTVGLPVFVLTFIIVGGFHQLIGALVAGVLALAVTGWIVRRIGRRGVDAMWPDRNGPLFTAVALVVGAGALLGSLVYPDYVKVRESSLDKAVMNNFRRLAAAEDEVFRRDPGHFVLRFTDLTALDPTLADLVPVRGENYRALYPRHYGQRLWVATPGRALLFYEPLPEARFTEPRLHTDVLRLPDGGEMTVHAADDGRPDGAVLAVRADGTKWFEAKCVDGRLVGPAWVYAPAGARYDALRPL